MSSELRLRRGDNAETTLFTGAEGEVTYNTTTKGLVTHDGATVGGFPVAMQSSLQDVVDDVTALTDDVEALQGTLGSLEVPSGSSLVGFIQSGLGAQPSTVQSKLRETVSFYDFGAIGDGTLHTVEEWIIPGALGRYADLTALQVDYPHVTSVDDSIDWAAGQAALNTNYSIRVGYGTFVLTDELLNIKKGRKFIGEGGGYIAADNKSIYGALTKFLVLKDTTIPRYRKTRRQAPETSAGPNDNPISCVINNQAEACLFADFAIELACDYANNSPTNLGGDCDVGFFNGCRIDTRLQDLTILGYFRVASVYLDVTASTSLPPFTTNRGVTLPLSVMSGSDQMRLSALRCKGGLKGVFLAGAKNSASGNYYDVIGGSITANQGNRGSAGSSDLLFDADCYIESREHHSGYRASDPTMNPATENTDSMAACIAIDGRRASTSQGRVRRIRIENVRLKTIEAARLWLDRSYEVSLNWIHTEPNSAVTVYNTSGTIIDITDYVTTSYGPIACRPTSGINDGTDQVSAFGVWGTGIVAAWSNDQVTNFTYTRGYLDTGTWTPAFFFDTATTYVSQSGTWTQVGDLLFCDFKIEYSATDTTDTSPITIAGLPQTITSTGSVIGQINFGKSTAWTPVANNVAVFGDSGSVSRIALKKGDNTNYTYNGGQIASSGILQGAFWYRT